MESQDLRLAQCVVKLIGHLNMTFEMTRDVKYLNMIQAVNQTVGTTQVMNDLRDMIEIIAAVHPRDAADFRYVVDNMTYINYESDYDRS